MKRDTFISGLLFAALFLAAATTQQAHASAALLIEEPYGFFGSINPTGHAAIYLNRVCAETPIVLRRCQPGEPGVVLSRYSNIAEYDWVAIPPLPYLYAVESPEDVPAFANPEIVSSLQRPYAETHLQDLISIPDVANSKSALPQLLGVAYIRKIYGFEIQTTEEQDDRLIAEYNAGPNKSHFNLFTNNCADFSRNLINFYYPHALHRSFSADIAITTPKQIAKAFVNYAHRHEDLQFSAFVFPQVSGDFPRSHRPRGVVEALLKTKKYAIPIAIFHPYFLAGIAVTYVSTGRFDLARNAPIIPIPDQTRTLMSGNPYSDPNPDADINAKPATSTTVAVAADCTTACTETDLHPTPPTPSQP